MYRAFFILVFAIVSACAQVPYDENGAVIIPPVANFSTPAQQGRIDHALDELVIKIDPGAEEARAVLAVGTAIFIYCRINDCRRSRGNRRTSTALSINVPLKVEQGPGRVLSSIQGHENTQHRVEELAKLAEAFVVMAERDNAALAQARSKRHAASWVALYDDRLQKLRDARQPVAETRTSLRRFTQEVEKSSLRRQFLPNLIEIRKLSDQSVERLNASIANLYRISAEMQQNIPLSNGGLR